MYLWNEYIIQTNHQRTRWLKEENNVWEKEKYFNTGWIFSGRNGTTECKQALIPKEMRMSLNQHGNLIRLPWSEGCFTHWRWQSADNRLKGVGKHLHVILGSTDFRVIVTIVTGFLNQQIQRKPEKVWSPI